MNREKLVERAYQRGQELTLENRRYVDWLEKFFEQEYQEDLGSGDITSEAVLATHTQGKAVLLAKQSGIVGGIEEASWFFRKHRLKVKTFPEALREVQEGDVILEVTGQQRDILAVERVGLNVLQRVSGIATETRYLVELVKNYKTRVAATRKTVLRYLDKKAVFLGGGLTHRFGLWDSILIKDNHLEALKREGVRNPIKRAVETASRFEGKARFIEVETTTQEEAVQAARTFRELNLTKPCIVMLDNVEPGEIHQTLKKVKREQLHNHVLFEASGNITPVNIIEYAKTGIDVASLGYLTHSTNIFDMSLEMTL